MGICGGKQFDPAELVAQEEFITQEFQRLDVMHRVLESLFIYESWLIPKLIEVGSRKSQGWFDDLHEVVANKETKLASYTRKDDGSLQVIICGTTNFRNVLSDLEIAKEEKYGVYFHSGFVDIAEDAFLKLEKVFDKAQDISITGHSLGGGVAVVLAWILVQKGYKVREIVTFGQPRVTNDEGIETINGRLNLYRVVNHTDVVTSVPNITYDHFGELLWLTESTREAPSGFVHVFTGAKYHSILDYTNEVLKQSTYLSGEEIEWVKEAVALMPVDDEDREKKKAQMQMPKQKLERTFSDQLDDLWETGELKLEAFSSELKLTRNFSWGEAA